MSIRLLHFADIHIGMENYGGIEPGTGVNSRVMDFLRRMTDIVEHAEEHGADLAIFAGDAFKTRSPNPTFQREFARRIMRLSRQCPVVLLVGNHDIPAQSERASSVEIFHTLDVENVIVGRTAEMHLIETRQGPVQVATVPYPIKGRLLDDIPPGTSLSHLDDLLRQKVDLIIRDLAASVDPATPAVLTGHFTVQGARYGSERNVMLGRDVSVLLSTVADTAWDYVAMGHIHYYQDMNKGHQPPVVYSGSVERIDFGEEADPKGFCWVDLERGKSSYSFVPVKARPFITIESDVRGHVKPMTKIMDDIERYDLAGAIVRVLIRATPDNENLINDRQIAHVLHEASVAYVAAIQRDVEHPIRSRLGVERIEGLTALELLGHYFRTKEIEELRGQLLQEYAERIFAETEIPLE
jgi:exonuclease SbcD